MTVALIFVPAGQFDPHAARCLAYCEERGYEVTGIVSGDWKAASDLLCHNFAGVMVVSIAEHLDPHRRPRLEIVAEQETAPGHRRTRIIPRGAAT